jgi:hypothetical protein
MLRLIECARSRSFIDTAGGELIKVIGYVIHCFPEVPPAHPDPVASYPRSLHRKTERTTPG